MSRKFYDEDDYGFEEMTVRNHSHKGSRNNSKKEQAKKAERERRSAAKFEANEACIASFGMSIKDKRKADQRREQARARRAAADE